MVPPWIWAIICPIIAYLIGSIPFSYLVTKWRTGKDLREVGTKNVGGLNTMITAGFAFGFLAGLMDFTKGLLCVLTVMLIEFDDTFTGSVIVPWTFPDLDAVIYILVATSVVLGHNFSIYLKFKGGRGLGTSAGILCLANPLVLVVYMVSQVILVFITKYVRPSQFFGFLITLPIAFFIPIFPPWAINHFVNNGLIIGLLVLGIIIATVPKYIKPVIDMFQGKEYKIGKELKLTEDDRLAADPTIKKE